MGQHRRFCGSVATFGDSPKYENRGFSTLAKRDPSTDPPVQNREGYKCGSSGIMFSKKLSLEMKRLTRSSPCSLDLRSMEFIVSPKKVVGCRGGSQNVEGDSLT